MSGFGTLLAKELLEIRRTWRLWVLPGMLLFFGATSPILALIAPKLLSSLAGSEPGFVIRLPEPTALDAYGQFLKNLSQIVTIAVIIAGAGLVSSERSSGTAILVLTKPVSRAGFVLAKVVGQLLLLVGATLLGLAACLGITRIVFPPLPASPLITATLLWLAYAGLLTAVMALFSVLFRSRGGASGAGLGFLFVTLVVTIWPPAARYSFAGLLGEANQALASAAGPGTWPVVTALGATILCSLGAVLAFRRQEI